MILQRFLLFLALYFVTVDAHFLLADLKHETSSVRVTFAEPGAESKAAFLGGRFSKMTQITHNSDRSYINLEEVEEDDENFFRGSFKLDAPTYVTGFLDFGIFGSQEHPPDLRYTVGAQLFSSNLNPKGPDDDYETSDQEFDTFFRDLNNRRFFEGDVRMEGDFRIIMSNVGQVIREKNSYKVSAFLPNIHRAQKEVSVQVCLYHALSGEKLDCELSHFANSEENSTSLFVHPEQPLEDCTGYYALGNTTLTNATDDQISFWSSTYIMSPCNGANPPQQETSNSISLSNDSLTSVSLIFVVAGILGYLSGCFLHRFYGVRRKNRDIPPIDTDEQEDGYRDNHEGLELS